MSSCKPAQYSINARHSTAKAAKTTVSEIYHTGILLSGQSSFGRGRHRKKGRRIKIDKINYILLAFCMQFFIKPISRASVIYFEFNMQHLRNKLGTTYFSHPQDTVFMSLFSVQKATIGLMRSSSENDAFRSK